MSPQRRPQAADGAPVEISPQQAPAPAARREARAAAQRLHRCGIGPGSRLLDLCCGMGEQAAELARGGYRVTGVDIRHDAAVRARWAHLADRAASLTFASGDVRCLPLRGPFDAVLLLQNGLALFHENEDALAVLREVRRLVDARGCLVVDNSCLRIWREIAAGRYADGISEDGLWQMLWLPGRNVFAMRHGPHVRPAQVRPRRGEPLYRAWSLDELDLLGRLSGWQIDPAAVNGPLLVLRPG